LTLLVREKRPAALDRIRRKRASDHRHEARRDVGIEHDRATPAGGLTRAVKRNRAVGGLLPDRHGIELLRPTADADAHPGHAIVALARERVGVGVALALLERACESGRVGKPDASRAVRVDRVLYVA